MLEVIKTEKPQYLCGYLQKVSSLLCWKVKCVFMSNNIEQNGRQLSTEQAAPPTDPRTRNIPPTVLEPPRICRDFVWGICLMNEHCKYRHELDYEAMRSILKFCHDFQNRTGCARPDCTYLHTSREEENLFLTTGQIPRVLAERYASMAIKIMPASEPASQTIHVNEHGTQPPTPSNSSNLTPPPSQPVSTPAPSPTPPLTPGQTPASKSGTMPVTKPGSKSGAMPPPLCNGHIPASMNPSKSGPKHPSMAKMPMCGLMSPQMPVPKPVEHTTLSQMQMPSPVPTPIPTVMVPPPPPPSAGTTASNRMTAPVYPVTSPVPQGFSGMFPMCSKQCQPLEPAPMSLPIIFDPSRPPPPLPAAQNLAQKRPAKGEPEAGSSKARKSEGSHDSLCENCVQRELRNELYRQEIENLQREEEYRRLLLEKKTEEYENGRVLLKSLLTPEMFRILDEYIETNNPIPSNDSFPSRNSSPTYSSQCNSTVPRQFLLQLMEYVFHTKNTELMPSIESITRRKTPQQKQDVFASLFDLIKNSATSEGRISSLDALKTNGMTRLTNGPKELPSQSSSKLGPRYPGALPAASSPRYSTPPPLQPARPFQPAADQKAALSPTIIPPTFIVPFPPIPSPTLPTPFYQPYPGASKNVTYTSPVTPKAVDTPLTTPTQNLTPTPTPTPTPSPSPSPSPSPTPTVNGPSFAQYMARMPHQYFPPFE